MTCRVQQTSANRAFMKDVRTLSQSADLITILAGIKQLNLLTAKQGDGIAA